MKAKFKVQFIVFFILNLFLFGCSKETLQVTAKKVGSPASEVPEPVIPECMDDAIQTQECRVISGKYVTATAGVSFSGSSGMLSTSVPAGYYDGTTTVQMNDSLLVPSNIVSGKTVFGVTGSAVGPYSDCSEDSGTFNASRCSTTSTNRYVYTALYGGRGTNCSAGLNSSACWTNASDRYMASNLGLNVMGGNGSLMATIPLGYYDGSKSCTMSDTNLTAANIKSGVSIFGISGNFAGSFNTAMGSGAHKDKSTPQISLSDETSTYAGTTSSSLPTTSSYAYREVPDISKDDDGYMGGSVIHVDRTGWGASTCGASGTIEARRTDCAAHGTLGAEATWDGATKGNSGYGTWKLVTRTGDLTSSRGREVWQDQRTGLLWSSLVSSNLNWCKASGSNFITNNPSAQDDPNNFCDNATYQTTGTGPGNKAISACYEDGDNYFTNTGGIDSAGKASLGYSSTPRVSWRLPTLNDYKQADINGLRFVVPDQVTGEWSASVYSTNRFAAWGFNSSNGYANTSIRTNVSSVRCVGR